MGLFFSLSLSSSSVFLFKNKYFYDDDFLWLSCFPNENQYGGRELRAEYIGRSIEYNHRIAKCGHAFPLLCIKGPWQQIAEHGERSLLHRGAERT